MNKSEKSLVFFNKTNNYTKSNPIIILRKEIIAGFIGNIKGKHIIDIGCGNGEITKDFLRFNKVTFLDFAPNMLDLVKENISIEYLSNSEFVNTDVSIYQPDHKFDIVVCLGVIAHVENFSVLFAKLKELCSDDGTIIIQYTASEKLLSKFNILRNGFLTKKKYDYNYKINLTSSLSIRKTLDQTGLIIAKKFSYLPVSPLFSIFNFKTKISLLKFSYRSRLFSFLASEIILFLSKANKTNLE